MAREKPHAITEPPPCSTGGTFSHTYSTSRAKYFFILGFVVLDYIYQLIDRPVPINLAHWSFLFLFLFSLLSNGFFTAKNPIVRQRLVCFLQFVSGTGFSRVLFIPELILGAVWFIGNHHMLIISRISYSFLFYNWNFFYGFCEAVPLC